MTTRLQALITLKLGRPVLDVVTERRSQGASLRTIAAELTRQTGEDVSHATVAAWVAEADQGAA